MRGRPLLIGSQPTVASPACALPHRLEHVGEALRAAQQAASKDVTAAAISLLEAPPADLWARLGKVGSTHGGVTRLQGGGCRVGGW